VSEAVAPPPEKTAPLAEKVAQLEMALGLVNQTELDGLVVDLQPGANLGVTVGLKAQQIALRCGGADGILVDDLDVVVRGLTIPDLARPGPDLMKKIAVTVNHVAVRISRDWINGIFAKDPKLKEAGVSNLCLVFDDEDPQTFTVRGERTISFEIKIGIGVRNNTFLISIDGISVMGFLPVPRALRNFVFSFVEDKVNRMKGLSLEGSTVSADPIALAPIPMQVQFTHFQTRGRYLVVEAGTV